MLLKPISEDLGWSRTEISVVISVSIWIGALFGPFSGRMIDRYGPRLMTTGGAIMLGLAFILMSGMTQLGQFWLFYPLGRVTSHSSMLGSTPATAVANWFIRMRGRALGIQGMAIGLGGAALSLIAQFMIERWGWRSAFVAFAVAVWLLVLPALLVLRRRPEDIGLLPDGEVDPSKIDPSKRGRGGHHGGRGPAVETNFSVREALRTPVLWLLVLASIVSTTGTGALHLHTAAYLTDVGLTATEAAAVVSLSALMGGFGSIIWGLMGERFSPRWALLAIYTGAAASVFLLALNTSIIAAFGFAVLFGITTRGGHVVISVAMANFYGRANLGTIQGLVIPIQIAGLGIGQVFAPVIQEATGSYQFAFLVLGGLYLVAAVIGVSIRAPKQPVRAA